jgi:hypothetical protein
MSDAVAELVARLESDPAPRDEYHFQGPFNALRRAVEQRGETPEVELVGEDIAFLLHAHDHEGASVWGLYFGPFMSGLTTSGEPWASPPLSSVTPEILAYWRRRASETTHPVMRARYADLLWELPKKLERVTPDPTMARVAADSYLEAIEGRRYEHDVTAIGKGKRALQIALSLRDDTRVGRARDVLLALEESVAKDDSLGLWGFCFDTFVEPPNRRVPLSSAQQEKLVADLEARLSRFAAGPPDQYHPAGAEAAAIRLATYYRRLGRRDDIARVLRAYGEIVRRMQGTAAPLVVAHSMEQLYDQFNAFDLHADADSLSEPLRVAGEETIANMKEISVEAKIPREKVEAYFAAMLTGTASEVLLRVAEHFIPRRQVLETQLRELAQKAPISYLMVHTIKDDEGRTVARIGPLESDLEGQLVRHMSQNMQFSAPWLRQSMERSLEIGLFSADILLDFLLACPLFQATRRPMLAAGLDAYARGNSMAALHILIPQTEQALRELAVLMQAPIYRQRRGGGLRARTMDDLLRDDDIGEVLGEDIIAYLRILFTDPRGWNIRNDVCHGLASVSRLTMPVADRVLHALLVLALVRRADESQV